MDLFLEGAGRVIFAESTICTKNPLDRRVNIGVCQYQRGKQEKKGGEIHHMNTKKTRISGARSNKNVKMKLKHS